MAVIKNYLPTLIKLGIAGLLVVIFDKLIIGILFAKWIRTFTFMALLIYLVINHKLIIEKINTIFTHFTSTHSSYKSYTVKTAIALPIIIIDAAVLGHGLEVYAGLASLNKIAYVMPDFILFSVCAYTLYNKEKIIATAKKIITVITKYVLPKILIIVAAYIVITLGNINFNTNSVVANEQSSLTSSQLMISNNNTSAVEQSLISTAQQPSIELQYQSSLAYTEQYFNFSSFNSIDLVFFYVMAITFIIASPLLMKKIHKNI